MCGTLSEYPRRGNSTGALPRPAEGGGRAPALRCRDIPAKRGNDQCLRVLPEAAAILVAKLVRLVFCQFPRLF
jgi:hypothetical protein